MGEYILLWYIIAWKINRKINNKHDTRLFGENGYRQEACESIECFTAIKQMERNTLLLDKNLLGREKTTLPDQNVWTTLVISLI